MVLFSVRCVIVSDHRHQILGNLWLRGVFQPWLQAASVRNVGYVSHPGSCRLATTPRHQILGNLWFFSAVVASCKCEECWLCVTSWFIQADYNP